MALTYSDIEARVMNSLRLSTGNATERPKVQNLINMVYRDIAAKRDWWWLVERTAFNTKKKQTFFPSTVIKQINTVTLSSAPNDNPQNLVMVSPGGSDDSLAVYRVASTAIQPAIVLDAPYSNQTDTNATVILYQDAYSMPADFGKCLNVKRYGEFQPMKRIGIEDMSQLKLTDQSEGKPEFYSIFDMFVTGDPSSARLLQIHPYPDKNYRLEMFYKRTLNTEMSPTANHVPLIPDDYIQILVYGALARGYPIFLNDDKRGEVYNALFKDLLALMVAQQTEYASDHAGIIPDMSPYRTRENRRRGPVTMGSWFDRLPFDR